MTWITRKALAEAYALEDEAEVLKRETLISGAMSNEFRIEHFFVRGEMTYFGGTKILLSTKIV